MKTETTSETRSHTAFAVKPKACRTCHGHGFVAGVTEGSAWTCTDCGGSGKSDTIMHRSPGSSLRLSASAPLR
jgi:DnaJ-class molecular chaperone